MATPSDIFAQFEQLFGDFFGRLPDIAVNAKLSDEEAAAGTLQRLAFARRAPCRACNGVGGDRRIECTACDGSGGRQRTVGFFTTTNTCASCRGLGATYPHPCETCRGTRLTAVPATLDVAIPAGSTHASTIRIAGEGNPKLDGTRGDLLVFLLVGDRPDPRAQHVPVVTPAELPRASIVPQRGSDLSVIVAAVAFLTIAFIVLLALMH